MEVAAALSKPQDAMAVETPPKGRFVINLAANAANFSVNILVGLWWVPYLIRHLGVAGYGLIPLAMTVGVYIDFFTIALNSSVGRFMTLSLDRGDYSNANRIFNTSFWGSLALMMLVLGPAQWLASQARFFFNVPPGYEDQFVWLFRIILVVFCLAPLRSAFGISCFARNRFDLANSISIAETFVRVAVTVLLFTLWVPEVWHIGLAVLIAYVAGLTLVVLVWRYLTPMLTLQPSAFSLQTFQELTGIGKWILISQLGIILYVGMDLIVVNKMLGAEAGGQYGAVMIWPNMLRALAGVLSGVFAPTIISLYGRQDITGLISYCRRAVKFVGLLLALPVGLICGLAQPLLRVWLGPLFEPLGPLLMLMSFQLCVNLAIWPLGTLQIATERVRIPGILTCVLGAGNLGLALFLVGRVGWGMYGVAAAGAIMLTAKNLIFTPYYGAKILGLGYRTFYREIIPIILSTALLTGTGWLLSKTFQINTWFTLGLVGIILSSVYVIAGYQLLLTKEERQFLLRLIWPRGAVATA